MLDFKMKQKGQSTIIIVAVVVGLLLVGFFLIHHSLKNHPNNLSSNGTQSMTNGATTAGVKFDCLGDSNCPQITIAGDPEATLPNGQSSQFRGYADPSVRQDPTDSNKIWMSYSWPNINVNGSEHVPAVNIHLASSSDGGKTWQYVSPLWPSTPDTNKSSDNGSGYDVHEVSNLLPFKNSDGSVSWVGARWTYFIPANGGYNTLVSSSGVKTMRMEISEASTPQGLATADTSILAGKDTSSAWGTIDTNLSKLAPELNACNPLEPGLYYDNGTLYMSLTCYNLGVVVFSTQPTGNIHSWKWHYNGVLAPKSLASQLGLSGNPDGFTQADLVKSSSGQLLAIMTPEFKGSGSAGGGDFNNHAGCWVFQVNSLANPSLATDSSGKVKVLASVTASDLGTAGPGSCSYDPASATGIVIARRHLTGNPKTTELFQTGVKP